MTVVKLVYIVIMLFLVSSLIGRLILGSDRKEAFITVPTGLLAVFSSLFLICVPAIYLRWTLTRVIYIFVPFVLALALLGIVRMFIDFIKKDAGTRSFTKLSGEEMIYLGIFLGICLFQLYKCIFYKVADGDDAFYVAVAEGARASDLLYLTDPYTGYKTSIPYRYALAPFPMLLAILARIVNLPVAPVAHIAVPTAFTLITYVIYNAIATNLFKDEKDGKVKRYMFLSLYGLFAMFANFSINSAETFMLSRARQGKEALAAIVIPFGFWVLLKLYDEGICKIKNIILIILFVFSCSLCSLFGNVLAELMLGFWFVFSCIKRKQKREIITNLILMIPSGVLVLLYLFIG